MSGMEGRGRLAYLMAPTANIEPGMMVVDQSLHENPRKISNSREMGAKSAVRELIADREILSAIVSLILSHDTGVQHPNVSCMGSASVCEHAEIPS